MVVKYFINSGYFFTESNPVLPVVPVVILRNLILWAEVVLMIGSLLESSQQLPFKDISTGKCTTSNYTVYSQFAEIGLSFS